MTENPPASSGLSESDEKLWSQIAHIGTPFFGFVPALIVWLVQKDKSTFVDTEAKEALNFGILVTIGYVISSFLIVIFVGLLTWFAVFVVALIFGIKGLQAAGKHENYRYPFNWRIVK